MAGLIFKIAARRNHNSLVHRQVRLIRHQVMKKTIPITILKNINLLRTNPVSTSRKPRVKRRIMMRERIEIEI